MTKAKTIADLCAVLQVAPNASREVLGAAKKALLKIHHPDKTGNDEMAKRVNAAHAILASKAKRAKFEKLAAEGSILGSYRVIEKIAEGGFGATYKAEHVVLGELACLKQGFMSDAYSEAILLDEARALWDMRHYALPAMRDCIKQEDGSLVLVMSYIEGPTLEELVEKVGRLDPEHVVWISQRILNGLLYLHQHGVIHGDLKPKNIIIQPKKHLAIMVDFGLAAIRPTGETKAKGYTDIFSAPEMEAGRPPIPETDLFSLGKTMLYALGGSYESVDRLNVPEKTPDALCKFVKRLIVREPLSRPNWQKENLVDSFAKMRLDSFGRDKSNLKPIRGYA